MFVKPDVTFVNLQHGPLAPAAGLPDLTRDLPDYAETAALIANLDLVISVDTSVAHLAAALGRPTWIMLPYAPDWRWMLHRTNSPWYPSVTLYRQPSPGDWSSVIARVASDLS
jgi:ADP-heptose:LPS heptosyltransferase